MVFKLFGFGSSKKTSDATETGPQVIEIVEDGDDFLMVTLQMPKPPHYVRRRFHASRPRSRLMAQADTLEELNAYDGEPLGAFERLDPEGEVQNAMVAAREAFKAGNA